MALRRRGVPPLLRVEEAERDELTRRRRRRRRAGTEAPCARWARSRAARSRRHPSAPAGGRCPPAPGGSPWCPSEELIERRPLWPPSPPPRLSRTAPASMSSSSWTTTSRSTGDARRTAAAPRPVRRTRSCSDDGHGDDRRAGRARRRAPVPSRTWAACGAGLVGACSAAAVRAGRARRRPWRRRCGGCRHSVGPGLPSPTTSQGPVSVTRSSMPWAAARVRARSVRTGP